MDDKIKEYIVNLVQRIAQSRGIQAGRGFAHQVRRIAPREHLPGHGHRAPNALIQGRGYVTPHDVKSVAMDVLRHRIIVTYEAEAEEKTSEDVIEKILQTVGRAMISKDPCEERSANIEIASSKAVTMFSPANTRACSKGPRAWSSTRCASTSRADEVRSIDWKRHRAPWGIPTSSGSWKNGN